MRKYICHVSKRNHKKCVYETCGQDATHRVIVGSRPDEEFQSQDAFYFCELHLDDALIRARDAGYPIISVVRIGG